MSPAHLFLFDASLGLKSGDRQHTSPLGTDSFADFEIQSMHLKDHNLILPCPPSQPINGPLASALQHPVLCRMPPSTHPHLPLAPPETGNPEKKKLKLSWGMEGSWGTVRRGMKGPTSSSSSVTSFGQIASPLWSLVLSSTK